MSQSNVTSVVETSKILSVLWAWLWNWPHVNYTVMFGPCCLQVSEAAVACPKSDPAGLSKKRVRIALSKNTAHTTHGE